MERKPRVAFICVHNSCRSQIAEALVKHYGDDVMEAYSGGTEIKDKINPNAVRLVKEIYAIDMEADQHSKLIDDLSEIDIKVTMGCNVVCPMLDSTFEEDWGLDDPTGKDDGEFRRVIASIDEKIRALIDRIKLGAYH